MNDQEHYDCPGCGDPLTLDPRVYEFDCESDPYWCERCRLWFFEADLTHHVAWLAGVAAAMAILAGQLTLPGFGADGAR